jgi:hypothetical protein
VAQIPQHHSALRSEGSFRDQAADLESRAAVIRAAIEPVRPSATTAGEAGAAS